MTPTVRRATSFALVGTLTLAVPIVANGSPAITTVAAITPFVLVAALALTIGGDRPVLDRFVGPGSRTDGKLYGLAGFSLAIALLALLAVEFGMPVWVFVGSVFVLAFGNVAAAAVRTVTDERFLITGGFVLGGFIVALAGQAVAARLDGRTLTPELLSLLAFLAASGALFAALLRSMLFERDDPLVMVVVGLALWLLAAIEPSPERLGIAPGSVGVALIVAGLLGYLSYELDTASLPGMITGVLLLLLTTVLGSIGWAAMLVAFFGLGGLSTKFRYEEKRVRGIAEPNEGARGSGNVLANSLVALVAVLAWAASQYDASVGSAAFLFAFAGSVAAALGDTFSSEFGGLYDDPRLITTFETVEPGTDGAVTWQGKVSGLVGAGCVAAIAFALTAVGTTGAVVIVLAGLAGMIVDSFLGALLEGRYVSNQGVNLLATLSAALVAVGLAAGAGLL